MYTIHEEQMGLATFEYRVLLRRLKSYSPEELGCTRQACEDFLEKIAPILEICKLKQRRRELLLARYEDNFGFEYKPITDEIENIHAQLADLGVDIDRLEVEEPEP